MLRRVLLGALFCTLGYLGLCLVGLVLLRWVDPLSTAVHVQRRIESAFEEGAYRKQYTFVPLNQISPQLQHAVIAAEDGRFYEHHGIDWLEIRKAWKKEIPHGRYRGVSTITQQTAKNLFMSTELGLVRKPLEFLLAPLAERILSKERILEIYLNVVEWGRGVYGAEAAARHHYRVSAARLSREQAARLAACLPAPRTRQPRAMNDYSAEILDRMAMMGW